MAMVAAGAAAAGASPLATSAIPAGVVSRVAGGAGSGRALNVSQIPTAVATTSHGTAYVADGEGYIRALSTANQRETVTAGSGLLGSIANGAGALVTTFGNGAPAPLGVAVDSYGDEVVAVPSLDEVRLVAAKSGTRYGQKVVAGRVYTVAGEAAIAGSSASGLLGTSSELDEPLAVAVDAAGDIVIADSGSDKIDVLAAKTGKAYGQDMTVGHLYVVAGDGTSGTSGLGGVATAADLSDPAGVALTSDGSIVLSNEGSSEVDVVAQKSGSFYGVKMTAGDLYDVAGDGTAGTTGLGGVATAAELDGPLGAAVAPSGTILVADAGAYRVVAIPAAGGTLYGVKVKAGDLYSVAGDGTSGVKSYRGTGVPADKAELADPYDVAVDAAGNLLVADVGSYQVDAVAAKSATYYGHKLRAGHLSAVAGTATIDSSGYGAPAAQSENNAPVYLTTSPSGDLAFADYGLLDEEDPAGAADAVEKPDVSIGFELGAARIRLVPAHNETRFGIRLRAGDIYTVAGGGSVPTRSIDEARSPAREAAIRAEDRQAAVTGNGGPARAAALLGPVGVVYDHAGNLVIDEYEGGLIDVVAASSGTWYGRRMTAGHIYVIAGLGTDVGTSGVPAADAELGFPAQLAVDKSGNIVFSDAEVDVVQVIAEKSGTAYGDDLTAGDIYTIAGDGESTTSGTVYDGQAATSVAVSGPFGLALDSHGDVAISSADSENGQVWLVDEDPGTHFGIPMSAGDIYTIAGDPEATSLGNGGPALAAGLAEVGGLAFTPSNSLVLADTFHFEIRLVASSAGTQFGQSVKANDIYAIAGNGTEGYTVPGTKAVDAHLGETYGVEVSAAGNLLFSDFYEGTIDQVSAG